MAADCYRSAAAREELYCLVASYLIADLQGQYPYARFEDQFYSF